MSNERSNVENPYSTPGATLDNGNLELYQPAVFSFSGRIGRLRYLAYSIGLYLFIGVVIGPIIAILGVAGGDGGMGMSMDGGGMPILAMAVMVVLFISAFVASIAFTKRRLNDLDRTGWWFLISFIPLVGMLFAIYLIFFPGSDESNNYGPAPVANSGGVIIFAMLFPAIALIGIVAAIVIPMFATQAG